ncbi:MAG TPA: PA14 domain-containing protein, partial [Tepidisphaeraceae bacterium]|nr:PA14 domain-containing protein [Tepidisphaeraceae bacterium]
MYKPIVGSDFAYTETVPSVDFFYGMGSPGDGSINWDNFSTAFIGRIRTEEAGTYTFAATSDDDSYVYVNGQLVSAAPGPHPMLNPRIDPYNGAMVVPIELEANTEYNFVAVQSEGSGEAGIVVEWVRPGFGFGQVIPPENYAGTVPNAPGGTPAGTPVAPGDLGADPAATYVVLSWDDAATNEMRYVLERATSADFSDAVSISLPINATRFADVGVAPSTQYHYRLQGVNFNGTGEAVTLSLATAESDPPRAAPQGLSAIARADGVRLSFTDASVGETEFVIRRAPAGSGAFAEVGRVPGTAFEASGGKLSFTDASGSAGETYDYRVVAVNATGESDPSNTATVTKSTAGGAGVRAEYYNEMSFQGEPIVLEYPVDADEFWGLDSPDP